MEFGDWSDSLHGYQIVAMVNIPVLQNLISNSWGKHKANQYHDGDFIPDKTYWRQKEY